MDYPVHLNHLIISAITHEQNQIHCQPAPELYDQEVTFFAEHKGAFDSPQQNASKQR